MTRLTRFLRPARLAGLTLTLPVLAGCAALPEPDGMEAAILARSATLAPLDTAEGNDMAGVARKGLLLSPEVREAASQVSASADEVRVARAGKFPGVDLTAGGGVGDEGDGDAALELTGSQLLFDGGRTDRAVQMSDVDLQIDYITFQQTVDATLMEVLRAYQEVRTQADLLAVYRSQHAALTELEGLVQSRVDSGAATRTDLLEARRSLRSAGFLVNDTQLALAEARDRLVLMGGQAEGGTVQLAGVSCAAPELTDNLRLARLEQLRAEMALEQARAARVPGVSLEPVVRAEVGTNRLPAGLNLNVRSDLLQGGALSARVNAAEQDLAGTGSRLDAVQRAENLAEQQLVRAIASSETRMRMLDQQITLLEETRQLTRRQYFDMGTRQLTDLLDNEEEYYGRQAERVQLRADLASTRLDCAQRSRSLRAALGLEGNSLYGLPLVPELNPELEPEIDG